MKKIKQKLKYKAATMTSSQDALLTYFYRIKRISGLSFILEALGHDYLKVQSLFSACITKNIISNYTSTVIKKENCHVFPNFFLKIMKKNIFLLFFFFTEQNFLHTEITDNNYHIAH